MNGGNPYGALIVYLLGSVRIILVGDVSERVQVKWIQGVQSSRPACGAPGFSVWGLKDRGRS